MRIKRYIPLIILICNLLVSAMILYAGLMIVRQGDTNGYFVLCIGLQFFILRMNRFPKEEDQNG